MDEHVQPKTFGVLVVAVTAVIALVVGAGATFFLTRSSATSATTASSQNVCGEDLTKPGELTEIPLVTTNLATPGHYVRVRVAATLNKGADVEAFHSQWGLLSDSIVTYMANKTAEDVRSLPQVELELRCMVNERLAERGDVRIHELLFNEFVVE